MCAGKLPFANPSASEACGGGELSAEAIANRICESAVRFEGHEWRGVSAAAKELVRGLLRADPRERLRIDAVLQHPWLAQPVPGLLPAPHLAALDAGSAIELHARSTSSARSSSRLSGEMCAPLIERFAESERAKLDADFRQQVNSQWDVFQQASFKLSVRTAQ